MAAMRWQLPNREIVFPRRPLVMGIVNVNDDSFSGDGTLDFAAAAAMAGGQLQAGADVIDVGAESARTNREAITVAEEIRRFLGFLDRWDETWQSVQPRDEVQIWPPVLSVNSWRPEVIEAVLESGQVDLVNDMSGLPDDRNARLCAAVGASLLIMHSKGEPKIPHVHQQWPDVMASMEAFFEDKLGLAQRAGLPLERVILDPGIDFAKQRDDNLTVFREMGRLRRFGRPLLVPVSRKTVIGKVLDLPEPTARDAGTVACMVAGMQRGGSIFRVHNVPAAVAAVAIIHALDS
jgi:dihydropteroate synthase